MDLTKNKLFPLFLLLCLFCVSSCKQQNKEMSKMYYIDKVIYLPVKIDGKIYNFLFDTGTTLSSISKEVADKHDIKAFEITDSVLAFKKKKIEKILYSEKKKLGLFDKVIRQPFSVENEDRSDSIPGIIGADIIRCYNWFFDFSKGEYKITEKAEDVKVPKYFNEIANYDFSLENYNPRTEIHFNGNEPLILFFDTGQSRKISTDINEMFPILEYYTINIEEIKPETNKLSYTGHFESYELNLLYLNNPKLDGVQHPSMTVRLNLVDTAFYSLLKRHNTIDGFLTSAYFSFFDACYFDTKNQKVRFYSKNSALSTEPNEVDEWFEYIQKRANER